MSRVPPMPRVGEFHVLDFVGAGGMGEVFRAVHSRSGQVVAIKFLTGSSDSSPAVRARWRERFAHEARVQSSLRHPNLVAFLEWHEVGGTPCIVMELVDGQTLAACLEAGPMPLPYALSVFRRVVEAVAWMHTHGVVHRDIKTSNVKINARGEVKLLDFGIAKTGDMARLTSTGAFVGTLQYLSPEQVKGADADARCDVWALGALLYETLSAAPPFEAPTWAELLEKVGRAQFQPLSERCPGLPRDVESIVRKCLQKQPDARFADASLLARELERLSDDGHFKTPVSNPRGEGRASRSSSRSTPWIAGGTGAALLGILLTWMVWPAAQSKAPDPLPLPLTPAAPTAAPTADSTMDGELRTVSIDVFEGSAQTQIFRDGILLGTAPRDLRVHNGDTLHIELSRPGYQTRREDITVTSSQSTYTFPLDPLAP